MKEKQSLSEETRIFAAIHQDEIATRTREIFDKAGGTNHYQSQSISLLAEHVVSSSNQKLCTLQPRLSSFDSAFWNDGLSLVMTYLKKYNMKKTINTILEEIGKSRMPEQKHVFETALIDGYFESLLSLAPKLESKDFDQNVHDFIEELVYEDSLQFSALVRSSSLRKKPPTKKAPPPIKKADAFE